MRSGAAELYEVLYPDKANTHASLPGLSMAPASSPTQRRGPQLRPTTSPLPMAGDKWTDPQWLMDQLEDMDVRLADEARLRRDELLRRQRDEQERRVAASCLVHKLPPPDDPPPPSPAVLRQRAYMAKLTCKKRSSPCDTSAARGGAEACARRRSALLEHAAMRTAIRTLGYAAVMFKRGSTCGTYDQALDSEVMTPTMLDTFLRHNFDVKLTPEELGCVVRWMDANADGRIDATEFLREFWKFGVVEHKRAKEARKKDRAKVERRHAVLQATWLARFKSPTLLQVSDTYTEGDVADAEHALAQAAAVFDDTEHARSVRAAFEGAPLTPADLADIIRVNWNLRLSPAQVAALVATFDVHQNGLIDGTDFYRFFMALGRRERARRAQDADLDRIRREKLALKRQQHAWDVFGGGHPRQAKIVWPETASTSLRGGQDDGAATNPQQQQQQLPRRLPCTTASTVRRPPPER